MGFAGVLPMSVESNYGELEIALHRAQRGVHEVVLRLHDPQSQAEVAPVRGRAPIDVDELATQAVPDAYGRMLAAQVFADGAVRALYQRARAALERAGLLLRVRIAIEATAPELHDVRWELLRDPETDAPLATSERIVLSRFMRSSQDWRPIRLRPRARLRAVIAVSAPSNAADYGLAPFDPAGALLAAADERPGPHQGAPVWQQALERARAPDATLHKEVAEHSIVVGEEDLVVLSLRGIDRRDAASHASCGAERLGVAPPLDVDEGVREVAVLADVEELRVAPDRRVGR